MRLVDADEIYGKRFTVVDEIEGVPVHRNVIKAVDVKEAPTVEAIPIEWFKKEIGFLSDKGFYGAEVYQWVLNRWYEDKEEWEKENESNL